MDERQRGSLPHQRESRPCSSSATSRAAPTSLSTTSGYGYATYETDLRLLPIGRRRALLVLYNTSTTLPAPFTSLTLHGQGCGAIRQRASPTASTPTCENTHRLSRYPGLEYLRAPRSTHELLRSARLPVRVAARLARVAPNAECVGPALRLAPRRAFPMCIRRWRCPTGRCTMRCAKPFGDARSNAAKSRRTHPLAAAERIAASAAQRRAPASRTSSNRSAPCALADKAVTSSSAPSKPSREEPSTLSVTAGAGSKSQPIGPCRRIPRPTAPAVYTEAVAPWRAAATRIRPGAVVLRPRLPNRVRAPARRRSRRPDSGADLRDLLRNLPRNAAPTRPRRTLRPPPLRHALADIFLSMGMEGESAGSAAQSACCHSRRPRHAIRSESFWPTPTSAGWPASTNPPRSRTSQGAV